MRIHPSFISRERSTRCGFAVASALFAGGVAAADEIVLQDGTVLVGEIKKLAGGEIVIVTDFAGELTFGAERVRGIRSDDPVTVELVTGDRFVGTLRYDSETGNRVVSPAAGDQTLDLGQIKALWSEGVEPPALAEARAQIEAQRAKWSGRLEFGINGETGNTERVAVDGRAELRRTAPGDRLLLFAQGRFASENGEDTVREIIGGVRLEVDLSDRLFAYGRIEIEHDVFEDLDFRFTGAGGVGYFVLQEEDIELKVRGGLGWEFESFTDGTNDDKALGEVGLDFRYDFTPWVRYTNSTTAILGLDDVEDYRLVMENAAEIPLTGDKAWKLRLGVRNQYDNQPQPGVERLDTYYYARVLWGF